MYVICDLACLAILVIHILTRPLRPMFVVHISFHSIPTRLPPDPYGCGVEDARRSRLLSRRLVLVGVRFCVLFYCSYWLDTEEVGVRLALVMHRGSSRRKN